MLKKIKVEDVRLGMYLQEICASWTEHPFWRKSFLLEDPKDLKTLQTCGVREVWIDAKKGKDVAASAVIASGTAEEAQKIEQALQDMANEPAQAAKAAARVQPSSFEDEVTRARRIHARAKEAVVSMFSEARMGNALQLAEADTVVDEINQSIARNSSALLSLARLKHIDDYTYLHSVAVCALMLALGRQMNLGEADLKEAGMAGLLHDLGKMALPMELLNKPGKLTDQEFETIKAHPRQGWEILQNAVGVSEVAKDVCLHHHERVDGTGYPEKISGPALSLFARMGSICDVYDALTSDRCYKKGWEPGEAIRKMAEWRNGHFDEDVFHAFVKTVGIYPTNTVVKLKSGRLAVVLEQSQKNLLTPKVKVFYSLNAKTPLPPLLVDLAKVPDAITGMEDSSKWRAEINRLTGV